MKILLNLYVYMDFEGTIFCMHTSTVSADVCLKFKRNLSTRIEQHRTGQALTPDTRHAWYGINNATLCARHLVFYSALQSTPDVRFNSTTPMLKITIC